MRKLKRLTSGVTALAISLAMAGTGIFSNYSFAGLSSAPAHIEAEATTLAVTSTNDADTFSWDNASVYFLLTDRFKNGNTSNDHSYNRGLTESGSVASINDTRATFHGGDFAGITQTIEDGYFDDLGINALWISAPYEQIHGYLVGDNSSPSYPHYSYHGYYVLDYTQTDANFGTEEEFQTLVDTAHEHGIRIVIDIVMNHAGYNSIYDMNEFGFGTLTSNWANTYYNYNNVSNSTYHANIDYDTSSSDWGNWWGADWIRCGVAGYTAGGSDDLTRTLEGLPDFKTESTSKVSIPPILANKWKAEGRYDSEVANMQAYFTQYGYSWTVTNCISYWLSSWVRDYGVDGMRCDTAKHVDKSSWAVLSDMSTEALNTWRSNNPDNVAGSWTDDFWMTGEAWDHTIGSGYDSYFTTGKFDSMINFATCGGGSLGSSSLASTYQSYADAINSNSSFNQLSFISSHDEVLAGTSQDMIYMGSAFLLLPGGVQTFYGDESGRDAVSGISFDGSGGAGHSLRSDMNWDDMDETTLSHWQKVGTFRNNHIAVGAGQNTTPSTTSGAGFVRTYSKGSVTDRVAGVVGASANTNVTIDVSAGWADGESVVNYYDYSSATVSGGKVTFNSGANGTILIADPDGKPLVTFTGESTFTTNTETITAHIEDADYAIVSVDGAKKFKVYDGDTFEIGATAYAGDTISVAYTATNENGDISGTATFKKGTSGGTTDYTAKVHVKNSDGSIPYIYAWEGTSTALNGSWPGAAVSTDSDGDGYYDITFDTTNTYNVIVTNSSGSWQTADIAGLRGEVWITATPSTGAYNIDQQSIKNDDSVTIVIVPYSGASAPYLYVWSGSTTYNGAFPGKQVTTKNSDGNYVFTVEGVSSVNCITSNGSNQSQSGNITGLTGTSTITFTGSSYASDYTVSTEETVSDFDAMKKVARSIKNLTASDYTATTYNAMYSYIATADALVEQGEDTADPTAVTACYNNMVTAKAALVAASPVVKSANTSTKVVSGTAPYGSTVTIKSGSSSYTGVADEITGEFSITVPGITNGTVLTLSDVLGDYSSASTSFTVGSIVTDDLANNSTISATTVNAGTAVKVTCAASGGTSPYYYACYYKLSSASSYTTFGTEWGTATSASFTPSTAGTYDVVVKVKDAAGDIVKKSFTVTVNAVDDDAIVNTSFISQEAVVGQKIVFKGSATGGSGEYQYAYYYRKTSDTSWTTAGTEWGTSAYATAKPGTNTVYEVCIKVRDANNTSNVVKKYLSFAANTTETSLKCYGSVYKTIYKYGTTNKITASSANASGTVKYKYEYRKASSWTYETIKDYSTSTSVSWDAPQTGSFTLRITAYDGTDYAIRTINIKVKK